MSDIILPFEIEAPPKKEFLEPGFTNRLFTPELMYKKVSPFQIKTDIFQCYACSNEKYVKPLELSQFEASVMVVATTPKEVDVRTSEGKLLAEILAWAGFTMEDVYVTAMSKCEETKTPQNCHHHLLAEVLCVQPKLIIALGYSVGLYFDPSVQAPGTRSLFMGNIPVLTTYDMAYAKTDPTMYQTFCQHIQQSKTFY